MEELTIDTLEGISSGLLQIALLILAVAILLTIGVYHLAKKNGRDATVWVLTSLFISPILSLIILLCIGETSEKREERITNDVLLENKIRKMIINDELNAKDEELRESIICPNCKSPNDKETKFCCNCGTDLNDNIICHNCQKLNNRKNKFCCSCGIELSVLKGDLDDSEVLNNLLRILNQQSEK